MSRFLIHILIPLLLPVVLYGLWAYFNAKRKDQGLPSWEEGSWFWAIIVGFVLAVAGFGYLFWTTTGGQRDIPVPPAQSSSIVPGRFV